MPSLRSGRSSSRSRGMPQRGLNASQAVVASPVFQSPPPPVPQVRQARSPSPPPSPFSPLPAGQAPNRVVVVRYRPSLLSSWLKIACPLMCIPYPEGDDMTRQNMDFVETSVFIKFIISVVVYIIPQWWLWSRSMDVVFKEFHVNDHTTFKRRVITNSCVLIVDVFWIVVYHILVSMFIINPGWMRLSYGRMNKNLQISLCWGVVVLFVMALAHMYRESVWDEMNKSTLSIWHPLIGMMRNVMVYIFPRS